MIEINDDPKCRKVIPGTDFPLMMISHIQIVSVSSKKKIDRRMNIIVEAKNKILNVFDSTKRGGLVSTPINSPFTLTYCVL